MEHLDENEIAAYVESIEAGNLERLPENVRDHVEECLECKVEIMEALELVLHILASFRWDIQG